MHTVRTSRQLVRQSGFTRIELAVVLGIIALLAFMFLPGLQVVRDGPNRRAECLNNMRQVGIATINFASAHQGTFPEMVGPYNGEMHIDANNTKEPASWTVTVLPYLDQGGLYDRLFNSSRKETFNELAATRIRVFVCPSSQVSNDAAVNSYVANGGYMTLSRWSSANRVDNGHSIDGYNWQADGVGLVTVEDRHITRAFFDFVFSCEPRRVSGRARQTARGLTAFGSQNSCKPIQNVL